MGPSHYHETVQLLVQQSFTKKKYNLQSDAKTFKLHKLKIIKEIVLQITYFLSFLHIVLFLQL